MPCRYPRRKRNCRDNGNAGACLSDRHIDRSGGTVYQPDLPLFYWWCFRFLPFSHAMCKRECLWRSLTIAAPLPQYPGRCRKRCIISAPYTRPEWRPTWSAATTGASAKAMPPWRKRTFTTQYTPPWCFC